MIKSKQIKEELQNLEDEIRKASSKFLVAKTGLKQPDISAWKTGKRKWSYEKILKIAEKTGL